jgi:hypothetical protein
MVAISMLRPLQLSAVPPDVRRAYHALSLASEDRTTGESCYRQPVARHPLR